MHVACCCLLHVHVQKINISLPCDVYSVEAQVEAPPVSSFQSGEDFDVQKFRVIGSLSKSSDRKMLRAKRKTFQSILLKENINSIDNSFNVLYS